MTFRLSHPSVPTALIAAILCASATPIAAQNHDDIVTTAVKAGQFKTLAAALKAGGLVKALQGKGPFTVFAPTDTAFAKLPKGTVQKLLQPGQRGTLQAILKYHVVAGKLLAKDVVQRFGATTLNGQAVAIAVGDDGVRLDDSKVIKTDIRCSNGVIHVIDRVLMPELRNAVELAQSTGKFGTLLAAAKAAGLAKTLASDGPFTIFAPTDAAFEALPAGTVEQLLQRKNRGKLQDILKYHVVKGRVSARDLITAGSGTTLQGQSVRGSLRSGALFVNDSRVVANDVKASNATIHIVDAVLLPKAPAVDPNARKVIGVYLEEASKALAAQLHVRPDRALVITNFTGSNARDAGLRQYDVITHIEGNPATNAQLTKAKNAAGIGGTIALTVRRAGRKLNVDVPVIAGKH